MIIASAYRRLAHLWRIRSSDALISQLRSSGITIGEDVTFFGDLNLVRIDLTRPSLVKIGSHVKIVSPFSLLTHGFEWTVFREKYKEILGSSGKVVIGDNVYFGRECCVLKGTTIGNNVIIGAKSLVNKDIPSDCVAAGVPARMLTGLDEYFQKRNQAQVAEAKEYARSIYEVEKRVPDPADFFEFFPLFLKRDEASIATLNDQLRLKMKGRRRPMTVQFQLGPAYENFMRSEPVYPSFEAFLEDARIPALKKD
jgi:acetyltransferase-like isoleucine patch superfamily enzyme